VTADDGTTSTYSGDRNQNVYTSRLTSGLVVRFQENAKALSSTASQRSFSLLIKNTVSPLNTTPLASPSYYRILLGVTSTAQTTSCAVTGGSANLPGTNSCYLDITVNPKSTWTEAVTINSSSSSASLNVLVAQEACIPGVTTNGVTCSSTPSYVGLQALAVINADPSNPSVADPDFLTTDNDNPDVATPYGALPIASGEQYDPTVDGPPDPTTGIFTPKIGVPAIFTPKIGTEANNAPTIATPTVFTPKIGSPISSVQVVNPTIVNTIFTPKIFTPKIFTPKIVSPDIFTPKINSLSDGTSNSITDYSWRVTNRGNTSASYGTSEFSKSAGVSCCPASCASANSCTQSPGCSVCQLVQQKVYENPVANRDYNSASGAGVGNPTCDLNVQQQYVTVASVPDPAFGTDSNSPTSPNSSTLSLHPGEGNRVTLRVVAPPVSETVAPVKTVATSFSADKGQGVAAGSLIITTTALPVAVIGQNYTATMLMSQGGFGTAAWSIPPDPSNPVAAPLPVPANLLNLGVGGLTITQLGQVSTNVIPQSTGVGTYPVNLQVQDSAAKPSLDPQQVTLQVNSFTISNVDPQILNEVGSAGYMKAGDSATVTVTISSQGPATATSVAPTLTVNSVAGGTPSGPAPIVPCGSPTPSSAMMAGNTTQLFSFSCTAVGGNGYVSFTANAAGFYVNSAASVRATAVPVTEPQSTNGTLPNIIVDSVPPTLTFANASPAPNQYGWNNTNVTFATTTGDNLSGVHTVAPNPLVLSTEGKNVSGQVMVTDYANNSATFTAPTTGMPAVNIDKTPPVIMAASNYTAGTWTNQNVAVTFTCSDNLSGPLVTTGVTNPIISGIPASGATLSYSQNGLSSTATVSLTAETASTTLSASCQDFAGNNATVVQFGPIMIDKTPPVLTLMSTTPNGAYVASTWTNQSVTVAYACADTASTVANSGVATFAPMQQIFSTETSNGMSTSSCTDAAGNVSIASFSPIMIDKTPPVLTVSDTNADSTAYIPGTWTNQSVTVTYSCVDNASALNINSGLAAGSPTAPQTFTAETPLSGTSTTGTCFDKAGNIATNAPLTSGVIQIDKTAPTVTATANLNSSGGPSYTAGTWTNQSVVVTFACGDSLSGVKTGSITGSTSYGSQGSYTANGSCQDNAGNTGNGSFGPVLIDTTTPSVMITSPVAQSYVLNQTITPNYTCGDNSGGDTVTCTANPPASPYIASSVGPATFSVHGVDQAGNVTNPDPSVSYLIIYNFTGFQSPLQAAVMLNPPNPATPPQPSDSGSFAIGTTIPIAWQMQDANSVYISDLTMITSIVAVSNPACIGTVSGTGITLYNSSTGQSAFSYNNATNSFVFNWDTTNTTAGCYNLVVTPNDTAQWSTIVHLN
jgi:hypothetical protein